ncbi:MAG: redoxin domain-containing protein, partial [Flavobacteriaceae bacterium]
MNTLQVGDKLPPFTVNDQNGNTISDTDYANQKLVVFFYPKA